MSHLAPVPDTATVPPQNLEAEESVLGAIMLAPGAITACREILRSDGGEFYRESHARIWRAALAIADAGEPVDAITLTDQLEESGELEGIGGRARVYELAALVPATANADHYARIVVENARLRELIRVGGMIARLGWERPGEIGELEERARRLISDLDRSTGASILEVETWAQFERSATEHMPTIVDGLWPAGGLGFIAAPPKKGKTWVGLSLAISVAAGKPFLASFDVAKPEPVVLVALEGHRAAIRGRIGCIARGLGVDPDHGSHDLDNLHIVYKPAGLNLTDPAWVRTVRDLVDRVGAKLLIIDVLRAAVVLKENSNDEFRDLLRALQPLQATGCAIAMLHHFGKLTEISRDRSPGERMAGAGAMYGAFDVGVFITGSDDGGRRLRLEFETRDLANPEPHGVYLAGDPTGKNGGFIYTDAAAWIQQEHAPDEADVTANAAEVKAWLEEQPGQEATHGQIAAAFECDPRTITRRRPSYERAGIQWAPARGAKPIRYWLPAGGHDKVDTCPPKSVSTQETLDLQDESDASLIDTTRVDTALCPPTEVGDLQADLQVDKVDSPTESRPSDDAASDEDIEWPT